MYSLCLQVYWYKNNEEIDFSYVIKDDRAENRHLFTVEPSDNEATYRCDVSNLVTPVPLSAEVKLTVQCKEVTNMCILHSTLYPKDHAVWLLDSVIY